MKKETMLGLVAAAVLVVPGLSLGADQPNTGQQSRQSESKEKEQVATSPQGLAFPDSERCSRFTPCRNLVGEIVRIEESYWIRQPNGGETRVHVTGDTSMQTLPKVGDKIAAQVDSTGDATAVKKIKEFPQLEIQVPQKTHEDLR